MWVAFGGWAGLVQVQPRLWWEDDGSCFVLRQARQVPIGHSQSSVCDEAPAVLSSLTANFERLACLRQAVLFSAFTEFQRMQADSSNFPWSFVFVFPSVSSPLSGPWIPGGRQVRVEIPDRVEIWSVVLSFLSSRCVIVTTTRGINQSINSSEKFDASTSDERRIQLPVKIRQRTRVRNVVDEEDWWLRCWWGTVRV